MDKGKAAFFAAAFALTAALTAVTVTTGMTLHARLIAVVRADDAVKEAEEENKALTIRRDLLKSDVGSKTDDTERREELNKKITDITGKIETAKSGITSARAEATEISSKFAEVNKVLTALKSGMNMREGETRSLKNSRLSCPEQINPGRYIAEGGGTITITADNGTARASESLSETDTNSYTFDIAEGESVKADGEIDVTELRPAAVG